MAKQFIVARGQIEQGKKKLARRGDRYTPKNSAERDRLLAAGVIVEPRPTKAASHDDGDTAGGGAGAGDDTGTSGAGGGEGAGA